MVWNFSNSLSYICRLLQILIVQLPSNPICKNVLVIYISEFYNKVLLFNESPPLFWVLHLLMCLHLFSVCDVATGVICHAECTNKHTVWQPRRLQEVNQMCRSVETVKCICKLIFWKAADIINMKRETVKLTVTIRNAQVHMVLETSNKLLIFWGEGKRSNKCSSVNFKGPTYTHSLFHIKEFIYHKFTPYNDHALYLIDRTVYNCRAIMDNQTFHWASRLCIATIKFPTQNH